MATEIYNQVSGQQNFTMGATVSVVLLIPAVLAFLVDRMVQRRRYALVTSSSQPLIPRPRHPPDRGSFPYCTLVVGSHTRLYPSNALSLTRAEVPPKLHRSPL